MIRHISPLRMCSRVLRSPSRFPCSPHAPPLRPRAYIACAAVSATKRAASVEFLSLFVGCSSDFRQHDDKIRQHDDMIRHISPLLVPSTLRPPCIPHKHATLCYVITDSHGACPDRWCRLHVVVSLHVRKNLSSWSTLSSERKKSTIFVSVFLISTRPPRFTLCCSPLPHLKRPFRSKLVV